MSPENFVKAQMCLLAWREGHKYGGLDNMEAILHLLCNRQRAGWEGGDWLNLVANYHNHSGHPSWQITGFPDMREHSFQRLLQVVDPIFDGSPDRLTAGALYCAELDESLDPVFRETIVRNPEHKRCAVVGPVYFFR